MLPSWIRSSSDMPRPMYFLATETTSRRFASVRRRRAWRPRITSPSSWRRASGGAALGAGRAPRRTRRAPSGSPARPRAGRSAAGPGRSRAGTCGPGRRCPRARTRGRSARPRSRARARARAGAAPRPPSPRPARPTASASIASGSTSASTSTPSGSQRFDLDSFGRVGQRLGLDRPRAARPRNARARRPRPRHPRAQRARPFMLAYASRSGGATVCAPRSTTTSALLGRDSCATKGPSNPSGPASGIIGQVCRAILCTLAYPAASTGRRSGSEGAGGRSRRSVRIGPSVRSALSSSRQGRLSRPPGCRSRPRTSAVSSSRRPRSRATASASGSLVAAALVEPDQPDLAPVVQDPQLDEHQLELLREQAVVRARQVGAPPGHPAGVLGQRPLDRAQQVLARDRVALRQLALDRLEEGARVGAVEVVRRELGQRRAPELGVDHDQPQQVLLERQPVAQPLGLGRRRRRAAAARPSRRRAVRRSSTSRTRSAS